MTFPSPPFPPWATAAARGSEVACDGLLIVAAVMASRGAPASLALALGTLEWLWPALIGLGGVSSAIGTLSGWLRLKLAGCSLSAGGFISWACALLLGHSTSGQYALAAALIAATGLLVYRVVVTLAMIHLQARGGASVS
ncbi:hypothetical protein [Kineosporia succinea]|uniref:DUF3054 family protein n=1 Tax=Kineosporia succinea TaxID=84632 RepID=A0ABT9P5R6_9ACTN|nr:hypothetical protein [Kineosporia succinea]MDP9828034.1 hypothetical protein [Kineosporia succinea]